ncbi:LOW QUALITY PROTEIN: trihelix transcription factor GT-2-like [Phalaenopsis equestris]|uniref:LOW QUALITY PROTEIN: trihelix transcription factor GT-2-like n=1 Tax=Phalaenopsis equestris TaxID=78828 RepID=UPI0009E6433D|nr:LOW QUALITY PROTEIN: trihelix transcription factor GT-2-like [Phalaenopsis equestris]
MEMELASNKMLQSLWACRKLAELGYTRSAKKCKEKFENVHKYYKRTKEGRAGRQDGKSYRFFTQLEALHSTTNTAVPSFSPATNINPFPPLTSNPSAPSGDLMALTAVDTAQPPPTTAHAGISFSSDTSSSSSSDSDAENNDYGGAGELPDGGRKRKREGWPYGNGKTIAFFDDGGADKLPYGGRKRKREGWSYGNGKMIAFFEKLMNQLIERQEAMQQRFLDTIEKREQDRMAREEAWKRQEMARLNHEYELMVQERTMTANHDAAVISFLQRFAGAGLTVTNQQNALIEATTFSAPAPPEVSQEDQPEGQRSHQVNEIVIHQASASLDPAASNAEMVSEVMEVSMSSPKSNSSSSRWPKTEVLALIKLRSGLEVRYLETGPKGPFWEDISMGMKRPGYNRSPKRCKEKWENINKYFKKVKEGNKKRPEDANTCPYFHELDALYRRKQQQETATNTEQPISVSVEQESNNGGNKNLITVRNNVESTGFQMTRSYHSANRHSQVFFGSEVPLKKPENIIKELMEQQNQEEEAEEEDDVVDDDEYDDEDEEEDGKLRYEIQFQRQSVGDVGNGGNVVRKAPASVPPSSNAASFLAMVQ